MADSSGSGKLVVILHADVAGSTALVRLDERLAHDRIQDTFKRFGETIVSYRGRVHELRGDALLADFDRASDAVTAVLAFQAEQAAYSREIKDGVTPRVRAGIAMGEVIVADDTITGTGVVLAQRVEQLAEPGGLCITSAIHEALPQRLHFDQEHLGEQHLKGFDEPIRVYRVRRKTGQNIPPPPQQLPRIRTIRKGGLAAAAIFVLAAAGVAYWLGTRAPETPVPPAPSEIYPLPDKPSIAVLPFTNMSDEADQEYFSDGMTEDLITDLSKVSGLFVIARNSVFTYKGMAVNVRDVGRELGVRYVLEGSVRRSANKIRVNAQLIDATNGFHVWGDRFDSEMHDVFQLQDTVTARIVAALELKLTDSERSRLGSKYTDSIEAYDDFLRGMEQFSRYVKESNLRARAFFEKAIERDPKFVRAYANLARTYSNEFVDGWSDDPERSLQRAREVAEQAVALDPSVPQVHWVMGEVLMFSKRHAEAIAAAEEAISLDPNFADAYALLAWVLHYAGSAKDSVALMKSAMRLNPHHPFQYVFALGQIYFTLRQYDDAIGAFEEALQRNPIAQRPRMWLAASLAQAGRVDDAKWEAEQLVTSDPEFSLRPIERVVPYKDPADLEHLLDGLRLAGL